MINKFSVEDAGALAGALVAHKLMPEEQAGAFAMALSEIYDEASELFSSLLPRLMTEISGQGDLKDLLWNVQESCAHIHHHAKECKLSDDVDPWVHLHSTK